MKSCSTDRVIGKESYEVALSHLAAIVQSSKDAIISKTLEGIITSWNPAAERLFGYSAEEAVGQPITLLLPSGRGEEERQILQRIGRGETVECHEAVRRGKDGRMLEVAVTVSPIRNPEGRIVGASKIARDNSERKRAEEQARLQGAALLAAGNGIIITDRVGNIQWANPAFLALTGYASREVMGRNPRLLKSGRQGEAFYRRFWETILRGETWRGEFINRRKDGSLYHNEQTVTPVRSADGKVSHFVGIMQDVTERHRAEEEIQQLNQKLERRVRERTLELEAANKELEAFSYSVSHDLRAPLRAIDGFSRSLVEDAADKLNEQQKSDLQRIRKATQRMGNLINDLLGLARMTRSEICRERVDLSRLAEATLAALRQANPASTVRGIVAPGLAARADRRLLEVVLQNLLSNAWKFSRKQAEPRVEFGALSRDGETVFFVRDNGAGFDMTYADKLFGAFQRLHSQAEFEGTGVGLATVQRIIHRHGGRIWAEATVDRGATFYFTLPQDGRGEVAGAGWRTEDGREAKANPDSHAHPSGVPGSLTSPAVRHAPPRNLGSPSHEG